MTHLMHLTAAIAARVSSVMAGVLSTGISPELDIREPSRKREMGSASQGQVPGYRQISEDQDCPSKNAPFTTFLRPALNWCPRAKTLPVA